MDVHDAGLASRDRLLALRECVLCFAPYGFRATWHQVIVSACVPRRLDDDPSSLRRAVEAVEQARLVWRAQHPTERPAVVVQRVIDAYDSGVDPLATCRACGRSLNADTPLAG